MSGKSSWLEFTDSPPGNGMALASRTGRAFIWLPPVSALEEGRAVAVADKLEEGVAVAVAVGTGRPS